MVDRSAVFDALLAALVAVLLDQLRHATPGSGFLGVCLPIASVSGQSRLLIKGNVWQTRAQTRRRMRRLRPANRTMWGVLSMIITSRAYAERRTHEGLSKTRDHPLLKALPRP